MVFKVADINSNIYICNYNIEQLKYESINYETNSHRMVYGNNRNVEDCIRKHPVRVQSTQGNNDNAKEMFHICEEMKITGTAILYMNGFRLPNTYSVMDLKYFY